MLNLIDLLEEYYNSLDSSNVPDNSLKNYKVVLSKFINYIRSNNVDPYRISEKELHNLTFKYIDSIKTYVRNGEVRRYEVGSINTKRSYVRSFINFLEKRDYIEKAFSDKIEDLKRDPGDEKPILDYSELKRVKDLLFNEVVQASDDKVFLAVRNRMIYYLLLLTGMRVSEAVNLLWNDIDMMKNTILIRKGKGNKTRSIPLLPQLKEILRDYQDFVNSTNKYCLESDYVLTTYRMSKNPISPSTVYRVIKDIMNKANIEKKITCHNLRHTFVSIAIDLGFNHVTLSKILGHENPSTFNQIYAHELSRKQKEEEMSKFNKLDL